MLPYNVVSLRLMSMRLLNAFLKYISRPSADRNEIAIRGGLPEQGLKQPLTWQQHAQEMVEIEGVRFNKHL